MVQTLRGNRIFLVLLVTMALGAACSGEKSASEYLSAAQAHRDSGNLRAALIEGRNAVRLDQKNAASRALVGELEILVGNALNSEKELLSAVDLGVPESDVSHLLSKAYLRQGKHIELASISTSGLNPDQAAEVLANQASSYLFTGDTAKANRLAQQAIERDPASSIALTIGARLQAVAGDLPKARELLETALELSASDSSVWELLGDIDTAEQKLDDAVTSYSNSIDSALNNKLPALLKRAQTNLLLANYKATRADLDSIKGNASKLPAIALMRSQILFTEGKILDAQTVLEEGIQESPDSPALARNLAVTHLLLGNLGLAEQYGKQFQTSVNSDDAIVLQSAIRLQQGRAELAEQTLQPLLEANRLDALGARILATSFLKQDKVDEAITTMVDFHTRLTLAGVESLPDLALLSPPATIMSEQLEIPGQAVDAAGKTESFLNAEQLALVDAVAAIVAGDDERATAAIAELSDIDPEHPAITNLQGRIQFADANLESARELFQQSIESERPMTSSALFLASLDLNADNSDSAKERLIEVLDTAEGMLRERVLLTLANIEGIAGNTDQMVDWLQQAKSENKAAYFPSLTLAKHYVVSGEPQQVIDTLSSLTPIGKSNPQSVRLMAQAYLSLEQFDQAKELLTPFVSLSPDEPEWRYLRAGAFAGLGNLESLTTDLDAALRANPDHVPSLMAKTNLDIQTNRLDVAESRLARLATMLPDSTELSEMAQRLEEQSAANASEALRDKPSTTDEVMESAKTLWSQDRQDEALEILNDWIADNPDDLAVLLTLGNTYASLDRQEESVDKFTTVLAIEPDNLIALNNLAWQLRNQDPTTAITHATAALEQAPGSVATLDTLAMIHYGQGAYSTAADTFRKIQAIGTTNASILFHGAQIEAALGNAQAARELLEPLLDKDLSFPGVDQARALLESL